MYQYRALNTEGSIIEGKVNAAGRQEAYRQLEVQGLKAVSLTETSSNKGAASEGEFNVGWARKRVSFAERENFTRQLSSLLAAGVPLSRALNILSREAASTIARGHWKSVHDMIIDGTSLADAMTQLPDTFPRVYVAMVRAGETGGFLDVVLSQIADFQLREKELKSKVISALIYPAVLILLAISVLIFLLVFFIPRFQMMFEIFGGQLPAITRFIIAASDLLTAYGVFIAVAVIISLITFSKWLRSEQGRRGWQQFILRLPVLGQLSARFAMTRFCRMLGTLIGSGVPLINSLRVARESLGNQTLVDAVTTSIERVQQGNALASSLSDCPELFPSSALEMIAVAEETGRLDVELIRLATVTESDLDRQLSAAVSLAEPLLLFIMAAFIGTIFIGMLLPIFTLQELIQ